LYLNEVLKVPIGFDCASISDFIITSSEEKTVLNNYYKETPYLESYLSIEPFLEHFSNLNSLLLQAIISIMIWSQCFQVCIIAIDFSEWIIDSIPPCTIGTVHTIISSIIKAQSITLHADQLFVSLVNNSRATACIMSFI
jgi:hypothetical protein